MFMLQVGASSMDELLNAEFKEAFDEFDKVSSYSSFILHPSSFILYTAASLYTQQLHSIHSSYILYTAASFYTQQLFSTHNSFILHTAALFYIQQLYSTHSSFILHTTALFYTQQLYSIQQVGITQWTICVIPLTTILAFTEHSKPHFKEYFRHLFFPT